MPSNAMPTSLLLFLRTNRRHLSELGLSSVLVNGLGLALPLFTMLVYDKAVGNQVHDTLWALALGMGLLLALELLLRLARVYLLEHAGARWDAFLDERVLRGVLATPLSRPLGAGDMLGRLREVGATRDVLSAQALLAVADLPFVLLFAGVVALVAGPLVLAPLAAGGLLLLLGAVQVRLVLPRLAQAHEATRAKLGVLVDVLAAREALHGRPDAQRAQAAWRHQAQAGARAAARARLWSQWHLQLLPTVMAMTSVVVLVWGVFRVEAQLLSVGGLISANMLAGRLVGTLSSATPLLGRWREFRAALAGLGEVLDLQAAPALAARMDATALRQEGLRLEGLGFRYETPGQAAQREQLQGLNLHLATNQIVAVVGASGSGKSTLLRLLAGQLSPSQGRYAAGGCIVDDEASRLALGLQVFHKAQDPCFLGGSLREVVAAAAPGADDAALVLALRRAGLGPQLDSGELGLNSPVGTNGAGLSGGQRQMVALAGAFAGAQALVLLDEPTLGLDRVAQEQLLQALPGLRAGRCVVIATHAVELLQRADRVLVLERGRVVADGPPARLLGPQGRPAPAPASDPAGTARPAAAVATKSLVLTDQESA